jgi:hypothetical protein
MACLWPLACPTSHLLSYMTCQEAGSPVTKGSLLQPAQYAVAGRHPWSNQLPITNRQLPGPARAGPARTGQDPSSCARRPPPARPGPGRSRMRQRWRRGSVSFIACGCGPPVLMPWQEWHSCRHVTAAPEHGRRLWQRDEDIARSFSPTAGLVVSGC